MPLENEAQDGTAGSASTGTTGSSATSGTSPHQPSGNAGTAQAGATTGTPAGGQTGQAQPGQTGAAAAGTGRTSADDRSNWHPPHVHRRISRENAELKRQLDQAQQQLGAVTGIRPQQQQPARRLPPGVTEEALAAAREELTLVMPWLGKLTDEEVDAMKEFLANGLPAVQQQGQHYYRNLGVQTIRSIETEVKSSIGELSQRGMGKVISAFHAQLASDEEFFERWQAGDQSLVAEFVNEYKADLLDPYHTTRASAASGTIARARQLPRGGNSSAVVPGQAAETALDPKDEDAVHKRAFARMRQRVQASSAA